jgi:hypothetical protein
VNHGRDGDKSRSQAAAEILGELTAPMKDVERDTSGAEHVGSVAQGS